MAEDLVAMARAAEKDERLSDGALYGKLAAEIERLRALDKVFQAQAEIIGDRDDDIKMLREALAPFSRQVKMWEASSSKPPETRFLAYTSEGGATVMGFVSVGDVLKAHTAYQQKGSKE